MTLTNKQALDKVVKLYIKKCTSIKLYQGGKICPEYFKIRNTFMKQSYSLDSILNYLDSLDDDIHCMKIFTVIQNAKMMDDLIRYKLEQKKLGEVKKYKQYDISMLEE